MRQPTFDFTDQVVVVTGGSPGAGAGIAAAFVQTGASVVTCGGTEAEAAAAGATFVEADVRRPEQARLVIAAAVETFGRLDVLVNYTGGSPPGGAEPASPRFAESVVGLNLLAPFYCAQVAWPVMTQGGGGSIVNVGRISGQRPSPGTAAYGAALAGLISLTSSLAVEWAPSIRVNCVSAGPLESDERVDERVDERMGSVADVAAACLFLASPAAAFVTGANLVVDGGGQRSADPAAAPGTGQA